MKLPLTEHTLRLDKKLIPILALGLLGVLLLVLSGITENRESKTGEVQAGTLTFTQLKLETQTELEALLCSLDGVEQAKVYVTFDSLESYEYAKNEEDRETHSSENYVLLDDGNTESGLVLCIRCPEVRGVAAVCDFNGSAVKKEEITHLLSAALGISEAKIHISRMTTR